MQLRVHASTFSNVGSSELMTRERQRTNCACAGASRPPESRHPPRRGVQHDVPILILPFPFAWPGGMAAEHARDEDDFAQWYRQEMGVDLGELAAPDDAFGRPVTESLFANAASHSGPPAAAGPATRAPAACSPPSRPELASPPTRHADSDSPGSAQGAGAHRAESRPAAARLERGKSPLRRLSDMSISGAKQLQRSLSRQKDRISRGLNTLREPEPGARPVRAAPMVRCRASWDARMHAS